MKNAVVILLMGALAGCTAQASTQHAAAVPPGAQSCISLDRISGRHVQPPNSIVFEAVGPVNYRNDLIGDCPGLARLGTAAAIEYENPTGKQLCRNDRIRVFDPVEARVGGIRSSPVCRLGSFVPIPRG
jgi:hypothetical protein